VKNTMHKLLKSSDAHECRSSVSIYYTCVAIS